MGSVTNRRHQEMAALWDKYPEMQDSLQAAFNSFYDATLKRNRELAMEYASTPSGLQRLYMCRLDIPKKVLVHILDTLGTGMRESFLWKEYPGTYYGCGRLRKGIAFGSFLAIGMTGISSIGTG